MTSYPNGDDGAIPALTLNTLTPTLTLTGEAFGRGVLPSCGQCDPGLPQIIIQVLLPLLPQPPPLLLHCFTTSTFTTASITAMTATVSGDAFRF